MRPARIAIRLTRTMSGRAIAACSGARPARSPITTIRRRSNRPKSPGTRRPSTSGSPTPRPWSPAPRCSFISTTRRTAPTSLLTSRSAPNRARARARGEKVDAGFSRKSARNQGIWSIVRFDRIAGCSGARRLSDPVAERRFREIVPPLLDDAYTLAKWLSRSPTDAEDIVQDAALRALSALSTVSVDRPKPWFLAIVRNAAMTFMARNRRETMAYAGDLTDLDALDSREGDEAAPNPEQALIALQDGKRLRQAIASLPSPFLETLV